MNIGSSLRMLGGSCIVYCVMAACTSSSSSPSASRSDDGLLDAAMPSIYDAIANPEQDARADSQVTSGTRLKGVFTSGADGSKVYNVKQFWDAELQTLCAPGLLADGSSYCLPDSFLAEVVYSDAACTVRLGGYSTCRPDPSVAPIFAFQRQDAAATCGLSFSVYYRIGAPTAAPAKVYSKSFGSCVESTFSGAAKFFILGDELPSTSFVKFTPGHD